MGAFIIVEELELARVLSGNHKPTSEGWKTELVLQREDIGTSVGMTSMGNLAGVTGMVAKWFTFYITAALNICAHLNQSSVGRVNSGATYRP